MNEPQPDNAAPTTVIVGGGMLGASLAGALVGSGRHVVLLEAGRTLGGLASAWNIDTPHGPITWDRFYHVILNQDRRVLQLLADLGLDQTTHFDTVRSELLAGGMVYPLSSVMDLLTLPVLDPVSRVRLGATIALGAALPTGAGERITSASFLEKASGQAATDSLWRPLLRAKLGEQADAASARFIQSTFRRLLLARLRGGDGDRFGYVNGGYATILSKLAKKLLSQGVDIRTSTPVSSITPARSAATSAIAADEAATPAPPRWRVTTADGEQVAADEVVVTTAGPIAGTLLAGAGADQEYVQRLHDIPYLGCVCVSVVLRQQVTGGYLTYVTDETPYTAVVEMTNLVDPQQLGGKHLVYLPRYCSPDDEDFGASDEEIADRCVRDLLQRYPHVSAEDVVATQVAKARYVMPVPVPGGTAKTPTFATGLPGVFFASSAHVTNGTLNIETTLRTAENAVAVITGGTVENSATGDGADADLSPQQQLRASTATLAKTVGTAAVTMAGAGLSLTRKKFEEAKPTGVAGRDGKLLASISLDADNLWSYLKTHGDPAWQARPGYLRALGPRLIETFAQHGITATVFVVGHDADTEEGAEFVSSLVAAGHEIGNHSYEHEPWLHLYSRQQLNDDLARTELAIMAAGAPRPIGFRGPGYSLSPTLLSLLEEREYLYDASTLPTWIGPLARAYYFRSAKLSAEEREQRQALFGSAKEGLRPISPYRWRTSRHGDRPGIIELPVTTMPGAKVPIHVSYVLHLHQINPKLAQAYVATTFRACQVAGFGPSILLHPLDILDTSDAPGLEFFPGMALPATEKTMVLNDFLTKFTDQFDVVGTAAHARHLATFPLKERDAAHAGTETPSTQ